ncbi:zinc ABC transporter substrate-binding protein [Marinobacter confluentis]|uniref:High-affinity zinc uptake system protein ZnuA n=1 Tax=Marinobacter confluentis TaxID=1697557 RepID=A0A4Z1C4K3_9GAMM|nr:zinc ABC transporter substrate-binding protein [Marinobacter confluentis]TGN41301.1 ABC transporter substrate-binding protein [Marinobacter confluentis]
MGHHNTPTLYLRAAALALALSPTISLAAQKVVVSIKPLELLVRAVATENTTVTTLVGPGSNPHNFSMKPSQRRALAEADAVFWVGPEMETFLTRLLQGDEFQARAHAFRPGEANASDDDGHHSDHGHSHDHHHGESNGTENDPHIWLDPATAGDMAKVIHEVLASLPGADKAALAANLKAFEQALADTEQQIQQQLAPTRALSLFTYHNAFYHFAEHYDLPLAGVLTINPELSPGARHMAEVQETLRQAHRPCLMTERPFNPESWDAIVGDVAVNFSDWDPLASDIKADASGYIAFQKSIAASVMACL